MSIIMAIRVVVQMFFNQNKIEHFMGTFFSCVFGALSFDSMASSLLHQIPLFVFLFSTMLWGTFLDEIISSLPLEKLRPKRGRWHCVRSFRLYLPLCVLPFQSHSMFSFRDFLKVKVGRNSERYWLAPGCELDHQHHPSVLLLFSRLGCHTLTPPAAFVSEVICDMLHLLSIDSWPLYSFSGLIATDILSWGHTEV